ncbi:unnamed protein product [Agarophyton chilense]
MDSTDVRNHQPEQPKFINHSNANTPNYFSGFTAVHEPRLDNELESYLRKLQDELEALDPGAEIAANWQPGQAEDLPPSVLLAQNALQELSSRVSEVARDNYAARVVEALLRSIKDAEALATFLQAILDCGPSRVADMATHRCASHVIQTSINAFRHASGGDCHSVIENLGTTISSLADEAVLEVIRSPSGSHVFRTIIGTLSGLPDDEPREARLDDSNPGKVESYIEAYGKEVPEEWVRNVRSLGARLLESASLSIATLLWEPASCTALQALLSGLAVRDKSIVKQIGQRAIEVGFDRLIHDSCGSRFLERLILILGFDIVEPHAKGRLAEFAAHPRANFCLQRMLLGLKGRGQVMSAWDELETSLPELLGRGQAREGVILALLRITEVEGDENCRRRAARAVLRAVGATGKKTAHLAGFMALGSEIMWEKWRTAVSNLQRGELGLHGKDNDEFRVPYRFPSPQLLGTLMARCLMRFPGGPGQSARDSMAILTSLELLVLAGHPIGSRLIEQWIDDADLERSSKNAARMLKVTKEGGDSGIIALARNPYGAMVLIKCVRRLSGNERKKVMDKLASFCEVLKTHEFGQVVIRKCRVEQYIRRGLQWQREETGRETRERLFSEILNDDLEETPVVQEQPKGAGDSHSRTRKRKREKLEIFQTSRTSKTYKATKTAIHVSATDSKLVKHSPNEIGQGGGGSNNLSDLTPVLSAIESVAKPKKSKKKKLKTEGRK